MVVRYQNYNYNLPYSNNVKNTDNECDVAIIPYESDSIGSSGTSGVSDSSGVNILQKIAQIKNDLSRGYISIDEGIKRFKNLGIIPNVSCSGNQTTISFEYNGKKYTFTVIIDTFHYKTSLKEADVNHWDALQEQILSMGLRETYCKGVYCQIHNSDMPIGNYTYQKHYVWNDST